VAEKAGAGCYGASYDCFRIKHLPSAPKVLSVTSIAVRVSHA